MIVHTVDHYDVDLGELPVVRSRRAEVRLSITSSSSSCLTMIIMMMVTLVVITMMTLETFLRMQKKEKWIELLPEKLTGRSWQQLDPVDQLSQRQWRPEGWKLFEEIFLLLQTWQGTDESSKVQAGRKWVNGFPDISERNACTWDLGNWRRSGTMSELQWRFGMFWMWS